MHRAPRQTSISHQKGDDRLRAHHCRFRPVRDCPDSGRLHPVNRMRGLAPAHHSSPANFTRCRAIYSSRGRRRESSGRRIRSPGGGNRRMSSAGTLLCDTSRPKSASRLIRWRSNSQCAVADRARPGGATGSPIRLRRRVRCSVRAQSTWTSCGAPSQIGISRRGRTDDG